MVRAGDGCGGTRRSGARSERLVKIAVEVCGAVGQSFAFGARPEASDDRWRKVASYIANATAAWQSAAVRVVGEKPQLHSEARGDTTHYGTNRVLLGQW